MLILKGDGASTPPGNMPAGMRSPPEQGAAEAEVGPGPIVQQAFSMFSYVCLYVYHVYYMCMPAVYAMCLTFVFHVYSMYMSFECHAYSMFII